MLLYPISFTRTLLNTLFIATSLMAGTVTVQAADSKIPVESFFKSAQFSDARLSPDSSSIALLAADANDRIMLVVMETSTKEPRVLARFNNQDVAFFSWVNNKRLVYGVSDKNLGPGERQSGTGLFAIDKDAKNPRQLIERSSSMEGVKFRMLPPRTQFIGAVDAENSDDIYVGQVSSERSNAGLNLLKQNTMTGQTEVVSVPASSSRFLQDSNGFIRIAIASKNETTSVFYKENKGSEWILLNSFDDKKDDGFTPIFVNTNGELIVTARNGKDTYGLYRYDTKTKTLATSPMLDLKGFDFEGRLLFNKKQNEIAGIRFETDAPTTVWLNEKDKNIQAKIDALLPNMVNYIDQGGRSESDIRLITSFSDVHPASYLLFDAATSKIIPLGEAKPEINSAAMSYKDFVRYQARDGTEIPAYITLPKGKPAKNLPLVVLVHGGPYVRGGHWQWSPQVQFLASRGYAVIEPEFRGSTGYGKNLHQAGWKQWGLRMQDDLDDARAWAVKQGYADPGRVCIAGASYGGYAVLMGLIRNPELYRCGISWVGVSDINLLYDVAWSDTAGSSWEKFGMPVLIGDPVKDAEQLKQTSPLVQAARLKSPLILAYGAADVRVPLVHGTKFYDAVKSHNKDVEWIVYQEEAHGWRLLKNNVDFWTRVEKFLEQNTAVK